jgi:hypothetical protein
MAKLMTIAFRYCGADYEITYVTTREESINMPEVMFRVKKFMADTYQRKEGRPFRQSLVENLRFLSIEEMGER